jgi:hypothetical protein
MKQEPVYQHFDLLGQPIQVGSYVSFTWAGYRGVRIGVITRLTAKRVRMTFNNSYVHEGVKTHYTSNHIARPADCLVLSNELQQQLTLATLQKKI